MVTMSKGSSSRRCCVLSRNGKEIGAQVPRPNFVIMHVASCLFSSFYCEFYFLFFICCVHCG